MCEWLVEQNKQNIDKVYSNNKNNVLMPAYIIIITEMSTSA